MEGVGSRLGRASARYGPTQTVFNGPVRKWKKKWVHVTSSSSSSSSAAVSQTNGNSNNTGSNGSPLLLCKWTPLPSNPSDNNGGAPPDEEPQPKRRFRYTPIVVLEERKKILEEKVEDEAKESETNLFTDLSTSKTNEMISETALTNETQDSNASNLDLDLCLKGVDNDSDSPSKEDQLMKSTIGDLF
ncbi:hypothetical protein LWI29_036766 [Acer saccharum]|uniref:Uncharacterized protein n=1 Tax=Acer saccharum TaxID=4024 RepID=A0AA39T8N9_ACESA|nr:hypothetical protein LWI29_036766 [Acer saccharum]KAK1584590.1 hypothetical protein Q3G72_034219 [Acer saccharum]